MARPKLSTVAICFALFAFFTLILFPYQNLRGFIFGRIYKETRIMISADDLYPAFFGWPGLGMTNAEVSIPGATLGMPAGSDLDLACKKLVVRIGLAHLFPPTPSISLSLKELKKGGDLFVKFSQTSSEIDSDFDATGVELSQLLPAGMNDTLSGSLSGDGFVSLTTKDPSKSTGKVSLSLEKLKLGAQNMMGVVFAPTIIGPAEAKVQIKNGVAEIGTFKLGNPKSDLSGSVTGDIRLGSTMMQDFVNLTLRIQLSEPFFQNPQTETLRSFLSTYQTSPRNYAMKWSASLFEMSTNTFKALPQKPVP